MGGGRSEGEGWGLKGEGLEASRSRQGNEPLLEPLLGEPLLEPLLGKGLLPCLLGMRANTHMLWRAGCYPQTVCALGVCVLGVCALGGCYPQTRALAATRRLARAHADTHRDTGDR